MDVLVDLETIKLSVPAVNVVSAHSVAGVSRLNMADVARFATMASFVGEALAAMMAHALVRMR
jgi:hypothetical protein